MKNLLVTKSNHLVEAGYKLSLNEQRLLLSVISQLDGRKPLPKGNCFTISAHDFSQLFGIPLKQAYEILDDASSKLYERDIKTFDKKAKVRGRFRWVDSVEYLEGEAKVNLSFCYHIIPYLTLLHEQFTSYELKQITQLKSSYAIRFYEFLVQFIKTGDRFISIDKLRSMLEIGEQYKRFYDLKRYVIIPSMENINKTTSLSVKWNIVKKGRAITGLKFIFENK